MQRVYEYLRRHPTLVDTFWAVVLLVMSVGFLIALETTRDGTRSPHAPDGDVELTVAIVIAVAYCVAVALRRRAPERVLVAVTAIGVLQVVLGSWPMPANFAMLVAIFTVASRDVVWASRWALVGGALAPTISALRWPDTQQSLASAIAGTVFMTVCFLMAWVLGDSLRTRRAYYAQLEERARRLEKEREAQSRIAVAAERARIARELHDVVAHNVSVMVVQADGAAYVLDTAPDQARNALATISSTGRQALTEMRRLLGVLRTNERGEPGREYVPQPGVDQLTDLVDQVRGAGLTVDFKVEGTPCDLPSSIELTAYRIVQEALTNTRKHGGPDVGATVRLSYGDKGVELLVEDDGRGAQRELYEEGGADGQGHGLIGMRERVGMVGGTLDAGPRPGGGFRITAMLPLRPAG
ncbi:sensor histidine kinase [Streptomyces sp. NPDC051940]|uniref:sensor histidine kinase n=1 Tax=Streptomyces sp. NPDC051940 TaxID=3155675 RepID=UPI0034421347